MTVNVKNTFTLSDRAITHLFKFREQADVLDSEV